MSDAFFKDLGHPEPDLHLGVGSGTHAEQTGHVMIAYEKVILKTLPDLIIVAGDVNSALACTLAATKTYCKITKPKNSNNTTNTVTFEKPLVTHLEAGLRSSDRTMPEEINRLVT